jgi:hypothetical protein
MAPNDKPDPTQKLAELKDAYILSGSYFPNSTPKFDPGSLEIVAGCFFCIEGAEGFTLVATDQTGLLCSVDTNLVPSTTNKQHLPLLPLSLYQVPPGVVGTCHLADMKSWQKGIVDKFTSIKNDKNLNANFFQTQPVPFTKKDLKVPEDEAQKAAFNKTFQKDVTYYGQLIQKLQVAIFLVSNEVFVQKDPQRNKQETDSSGLNTSSSSASIKNLKNEPFILFEELKTTSIEYTCSLNEENISKDFKRFFLSSIDKPISEGTYIFYIPIENLNSKLQNWCHSTGSDSLSFAVEIKFGVTGLNGDFDFHILDPITIEEALITQFPEKFADVKLRILSTEKREASTETEEKKQGFETWKTRYEMAKERVKLITEFIEAKPKNRVNIICKGFLTLLKDYYHANSRVKEEKNTQLIADTYKAITSTPEILEQWDKLLNEKIPKLNQTLEKISVDSTWLKKAFTPTAIKEYALDRLNPNSPLIKKVNELQLSKVKVGKALSDEKKQLLELDRLLSKEKLLIAKSIAARVGKVLTFMDTAFTIANFVVLIKEHNESKEHFELYKGRFDSGANHYQEKFPNHPCIVGITRLEALRKLCDTAAVKLSDTDRELLNKSIDLAINVATYIPVIGEVAQVVAIGKALIESTGSVARAVINDLDQFVFHSALDNWMERESRLEILEKEYVANVNALKAFANNPNHPAAQFRIRAAVLIGLMRLIERCGSVYRSDSDGKKDLDEKGFLEKVKEYQIEEYINTYIHAPAGKNALFALHTMIPIDELWLYCRGVKAEYALSMGIRAVRLVKENWWALPVIMSSPGVSLGVATWNYSKAPHLPVKFQRQFPIHAQDSASVSSLARAMATNYKGFSAEDILFSCVYARDAGGAWVPVETYEKDPKKKITPITEIRVVVVVKGKNLEGMPVSLQLFRKYSIYSKDGPVYKGMALKLSESVDNKGEDKGLLNTAEESKYISTNTQSFYGFVFHPFYYFGDAIIQGTKPCYHIGCDSDAVIKMGFKFGAGESASFDVATGPSKESFYNVHLPLSSPLFGAMILDHVFLESKTDKATVYPIFSNTTLQPLLCGIFLKHAGVWNYIQKLDSLSSERDFDFSWCKEFEIIFLFHSISIDKAWQNAETISFTPTVTVYEIEQISDFNLKNLLSVVSGAAAVKALIPLAGPSYEAAAVCLNPENDDPQSITQEEMELLLRNSGTLGALDKVLWPSDGGELFPHNNRFLYYAAKCSFIYRVENDAGEEKSYNRLKPFGYNLIEEGKGNYAYEFRLSGNAYGLPEMKSPVLHLPGLPDKSHFGFPINKKFVTHGPLLKELAIYKVDYS